MLSKVELERSFISGPGSEVKFPLHADILFRLQAMFLVPSHSPLNYNE